MKSIRCWIFFCFLLLVGVGICAGFSATIKRTKKPTRKDKGKQSSLPFVLQKCITPVQVMDNVAAKLSRSTDPQGTVASLTLVRLCKQFISLQNEYLYPMSSTSTSTPTSTADIPWKDHIETNILPQQDYNSIRNAISSLVQENTSAETVVEGTTAAAVLARIIPDIFTRKSCQSLLYYWETTTKNKELQPHQLSGLHWAYACFQTAWDDNSIQLPEHLQNQYDSCNLPFYFIPGYFSSIPDLTVANLVDQVPFQTDAIQTTSTQKVVVERRETAWLGDEGVAPFAYSGKSMPRYPWSPLVETIRDAMVDCPQHSFYYDACLLNHYPDGGSAMRYHVDPDQGTLWDFASVVVSVGASRRLAFRSSDKYTKDQPHNFVAMNGDVMVMVEDCQSRFQHAVKPADNKHEKAARASLVFKKTLQH